MMVSMLFSEGSKPPASQAMSNHSIDYPYFEEIALYLAGLKPIAQLSDKAWGLMKSRLTSVDLGTKKHNLNVIQESELIKQILSELRAALSQKDIKEENSIKIMALIETYMAVRMMNNIKLDISKKLEGTGEEESGGGVRTQTGLVVPKYRRTTPGGGYRKRF